MKASFLACVFLALSGCRSSDLSVAPIKLRNLPPASKDVIEVVMASSQIPLSDASCKGFGTELTDSTIGRYLAGYFAGLSNQDARNAVTASVEPRTEGGQAVYVCRVMIRHAQGEDVWSWGVQFTALQKDGSVSPKSFQCVGAG